MISFSKLGEYGRFGNQLFQYAFLRTQAKKLGTKFYCPEWLGDTIFSLGDYKEKATKFKPSFLYDEGDKDHGFQEGATKIKDGTDIAGYFQSSKFFLKDDVLSWFNFNEPLFLNLRNKYSYIDFSESTAIHIRLGDYFKAPLLFYVSKKSYFRKALTFVGHKKHILVFSDSPELAKKYLDFLPNDAIFIEGNKDYEDFYLMSQCRDMICSTSTFSWWVAYLNKFKDKTIVTPKWLFLPGAPTINKDLFDVSGWTKLPAHRFYDHYYIKYLPIRIIQLYKKSFNHLL